MLDLKHKIESRTLRVGVVGLGYVGLPVAASLADVGFSVTGVELRADRVALINRGECPIEGIEPGLSDLLLRVTGSRKLQASTDYRDLSDCDVVLIDVETPVASDHRPRFAALRGACRSLAALMKRGVLVIVESTIAPGTTAGLVVPTLERFSEGKLNRDFFVGHCPERVMPGKLLKNLRTLSRACGGSTEATSETMVELYRTIVDADLDKTDVVTAELVKTAENTYRDVNIAFANELAIICETAGADFRKVRELVNKSPGRAVHMAGAGVGGHCIPKDSWLLLYGAESAKTELIATSRRVNDSMPLRVARMVEEGVQEAGRHIQECKVLLLGWAYLENTDDPRNSPSEVVAAHLKEWGAEVVVHDPWFSHLNVDPYALSDGVDAIVTMVAHDAYRNLDWSEFKKRMRSPVLVDGRHMIETAAAKRLGYIFRAVGRGVNSVSA